MSTFEIKMPKMGESVQEATITKWLIKENDTIEEDQILFEIATDKVDSEIPSPVSGRVDKILYKEGEKLAVGTVLAVIELSGKPAGAGEEKPKEKNEEKIPVTSNAEGEKAERQQASAEIAEAEKRSRFYSPLVMNIANKERITFAELEKIKGTGKDNRVKKEDLLKYIEEKKQKPSVNEPAKEDVKAEQAKVEEAKIKTEEVKTETQKETPKLTVKININEGDEVVEMDRMKRLMAEHMIMSKQVSAHVTNFIETDVTNVAIWREKLKKEIEKREKMKLTFMPVFIDAVVKGLKKFPMINSSVDGTKIIKRKAINIGIAVALPSGNLIVPVIKNADQKSILGIAAELNRLADNARNNKLSPDDISNGTFTITNFGSVHGLFGTPIINQPQVAILGIGTIEKKPVVIESPAGDSIAIRSRMYLSMSYDHRIIDGALSGYFLKFVSDYIENWNTETAI